ncbi:MAG: hypothetical protein U0414_27560 [Polyangiaceae bacterium]
MDKLLDAWRADPGVEPTVELCAMLTRASQKPGAREAIPSAFIVAFGTEALLKHPKAPDVHIAVAMLYESCGETRQAARLLDLAQKVIPDDPRVIELRKTLKVQRTTRELVSDMGSTPPPAKPATGRANVASERPALRSSPPPPARSAPPPAAPIAGPQDAETFDAPTTPLEPPTVTEVRPPSMASAKLSAPPKPAAEDGDDPPTRSGNIPVAMLQRDSLTDATTTDTSQQETLNMPVMKPPAGSRSELSLDSAAHPRRSRTLLGGVSALVPPPPQGPRPGAPAPAEPQRRTHKTTITGRASVDGIRQPSVRPPPPAADPDASPKTATRVAPILVPPKEARPPAAPTSDPGGDGPKTTTRVGAPPGLDTSPTTDDSEAATKAPVVVADLPRPEQDNPKTATRVAPVPIVTRAAPPTAAKGRAESGAAPARPASFGALPPPPPLEAPKAAAAPPPTDDGPSTGKSEARRAAARRGIGTDDPLMKSALERRARWQQAPATPTPEDDQASLDSPTRVGDVETRSQAALSRHSRPDPRAESTQTDVDAVDDPPTRSLPLAPPAPASPPASSPPEPKPKQGLSTPPPPPAPPEPPALRRPAAVRGPAAVQRMPTEELSLGGAEVVENEVAAPTGYVEQQRGPVRGPATTEPVWRRGGAAKSAPPDPRETDDDDASTFSKALTNVWAQTGKMPPTPAEAQRILREGARSPIAETTGDESVDTQLRPLAPLHPSARPPAPREDTSASKSIVVDASMIEALEDDEDERGPSTYVMKAAEALAAARVDPRPVAPPPSLRDPEPENPVAEAMLAASAGLPAFQPPPSLRPALESRPGSPMVTQGAMLPSFTPPPSPSYAPQPMQPPRAPYAPSNGPPDGLYDPSFSSMSGPYAGGSFAPSASSWPVQDPSYASGSFAGPSGPPLAPPMQDPAGSAGFSDQAGGPLAPPEPEPSRPVGLYLALGVAVVAVACLVGYAIYLLVAERRQSVVPVDDRVVAASLAPPPSAPSVALDVPQTRAHCAPLV